MGEIVQQVFVAELDGIPLFHFNAQSWDHAEHILESDFFEEALTAAEEMPHRRIGGELNLRGANEEELEIFSEAYRASLISSRIEPGQLLLSYIGEINVTLPHDPNGNDPSGAVRSDQAAKAIRRELENMIDARLIKHSGQGGLLNRRDVF